MQQKTTVVSMGKNQFIGKIKSSTLARTCNPCHYHARITNPREQGVKLKNQPSWCFNQLCILVMFFSLFTGCKEKKEIIAEREYTFRKEKAVDLSESDFFANKTIIPLATCENSLIHRNPNVKKAGENLFIYHSGLAYLILRFDTNGNFINQIGSIGNGPNEFTAINDIIINEEKSVVEVLADNSIFSFSFDGTPIKSERLAIDGVWTFTFANDYYWFYTGNNTEYSTHRLVQTDKEFNIINGYLSDKSNMLPMMEYNFKQSPYHTFRETFYYNMYSIQGDSLSLLHTIKFPDMKFPSDIHNLPPMEVVQTLRNSHYATILCYLENDNFIYFLISEHDSNAPATIYHWIINKKSNQEKIIKIDLIEGSYLMYPQLLTDDNLLYFLGYPIENKNEETDPDENPSVIIINISENFM